ncbi:LacI family transcriptional regulator [Kineosporia rhizophila]|uniref:LacI family DNA-binding transcriptional regulator n=1 Tax=Kineosporia TaxID=49184 RepID=UPI001E5FA126|nr:MULTISPECIES: LacI family DNA-binding transcriptional regulator [Kineosporia]MCE0537793.1 LacI family transcriptional regulator [Kineosporia rhizophila]GLY15781.1 LacI family transcriptional regulator [Kineosporia sp. NBRC 101677]
MRPQRSGASRVTLADVAARAEVSTALVSIVMRDAPGASPATRERVRKAASDLGYQPDRRARLLRSGRTRLLGVVFSVRHAFHGDLVTGLYEAAERAGYELTLSAITPSRSEAQAIRGLLAERCDAVIVLSLQGASAQLSELAAQVPVVVLGRPVRESAVDVVRNDDRAGLHLAVDHLVSLGHERIAHVDGGRHPGSAERRRGYREAMERNGLASQIRVVTGGVSEAEGAEAARALLDEPPTAVAMFNDRSATGLLEVARGAGLAVPEDLSVVGFDDDRLARLGYINLTTIGQDATAMTTLAIERAIDRIEGREVEQRAVVIAPHLVVRATTGERGND